MVNIIPATENDIQRILEIEQEAISPPWTHGALLSEMYKKDAYFVVAVDDSAPSTTDVDDYSSPAFDKHRSPAVVGFAILRCVGDDGELLQIAVDKAHRRGGAGDLLMIAALEYARENAFGSIFLEVRRGNVAAVGLYKKHGFNSMRIRKDYYSDPVEDAVVMVKPLVD